MGRFYFHLRGFNGGAVTEDEEGSVFESLAAAKKHAVLAMHELVAEAIRGGNELQVEAIVVADEQGTHHVAVPIIAALPSAVVGLLKVPEKVIPADRFAEYRRWANECRGKAQGTVDVDDKMSWLKLADAWLQMLPSSHSTKANLVGWPTESDEDSKASH